MSSGRASLALALEPGLMQVSKLSSFTASTANDAILWLEALLEEPGTCNTAF